MTRLLNFLRSVFKVGPLERALSRMTSGKEASAIVSKLVPNPYQYPVKTLRRFERDEVHLQVDISDYIGHYLYFGFKDSSQEALFNLCKPGFNVLDIGTNIGYSLLRMSALASPGNIAGFEPDPLNYAACMKNLELNQNPRNIKVYNIGLGETAMEAGIEVRTAGNRGANRVALKDTASAKISISRLDTIFAELNWSNLDLIKIDVEGYELKVLKGGESVLKKYFPTLFIEVNDGNLLHQGDSASALIKYLFGLGYTHIRNAETKALLSKDGDLTNQHLDIIATREL